MGEEKVEAVREALLSGRLGEGRRPGSSRMGSAAWLPLLVHPALKAIIRAVEKVMT